MNKTIFWEGSEIPLYAKIKYLIIFQMPKEESYLYKYKSDTKNKRYQCLLLYKKFSFNKHIENHKPL